MPESQGQLSSSQIRGWGYVCGLPAGTRCGVSSSSLPGSPPPHGSRRVTRAHSLVLRPRGLPGADLTPTGCLTSRVMMQQGREAHAEQWAEGWGRPIGDTAAGASGHPWSCVPTWERGGASPHRVGPALFHLAPQKTSEAVAGFSFRLPTPSDTPASKPFTYQAEGPCWHSRATFHTHLHLA